MCRDGRADTLPGMPRKLHVAMDELLDAMEDRSDFVVPYFNQRTGEVDVWIESLDDEEQLDRKGSAFC
jgi:hypothetical protein